MTDLIQWAEPKREISTTELQDQAVHRLAEWAQSADAAYQVAIRLSDSAFVPQQFRGKPVETTAAILAGLEVGLSPMQAIRSFDIINNTAAPRAITLRALVQSQGHEMVLVESNSTRCRIKGRRKGSSEWQTVTWTIERARDLDLTGKPNWKKQPTAMLLARATSELARLIASDAILGIGYSSEELVDGPEVEPVEEAAPQQVVRRMSRKPRKVAETGEPMRDEEGQRRAMFAAFRDAGYSDEHTDEGRQLRLDYCSHIAGRTIESSTEMTWDEVSDVIDALKVVGLEAPADVTTDALTEEAGQ